jgi:choline dehydrogenase-like flavoprotein
MPRTVVEWRPRPAELDTALRFVPFIREYLRSLGIEINDWDEAVVNGTEPAMVDTYHMMGGLRMGTDPGQSVVDRDLKVHGLENLYVASCAVFPSGSSSNPTYTLMALTLRLAEHLASLTANQEGSAEPIQ